MTIDMTGLHVVGIGGTLRERSRSRWALELALEAAESAGASFELLDVYQLQLPMYVPDKPLKAYDKNVAAYIDSARRADAMLWSTGAYHGTLAGVTKNAIDFLEFLSGGPQPYLHNKVVGLIATAGGDMAGVNAISAMNHAVHSLRGTVAPLHVLIPHAWKTFDDGGNLRDQKRGERLDMLGRQVVEMAGYFRWQAEIVVTGSH